MVNKFGSCNASIIIQDDWLVPPKLDLVYPAVEGLLDMIYNLSFHEDTLCLRQSAIGSFVFAEILLIKLV